jgi:hypothetical protein
MEFEDSKENPNSGMDGEAGTTKPGKQAASDCTKNSNLILLQKRL